MSYGLAPVLRVIISCKTWFIYNMHHTGPLTPKEVLTIGVILGDMLTFNGANLLMESIQPPLLIENRLNLMNCFEKNYLSNKVLAIPQHNLSLSVCTKYCKNIQ